MPLSRPSRATHQIANRRIDNACISTPFSEGRNTTCPPVEAAVLCATRLDLLDRTWNDKTSRFGIVMLHAAAAGPPRDARTLRKTTP